MTKESQKTNTMTAEETARQNSFIELAQTLSAQKSNTLGRPLTYWSDHLRMSDERETV